MHGVNARSHCIFEALGLQAACSQGTSRSHILRGSFVGDIRDHFVVDLESRKPSVLLYDAETIQGDMAFYGVKTPLELTDWDWKVFKEDWQAEMWLHTYKMVLADLDNNRICKSRDLPAILYKRKYMVQTLMGEKMQTYRHYNKGWKRGQLFNLHDQVYFLTVRLEKIEDTENGYCYTFKMP